jgi:curved DNA-binding protein CbpA
MTAESQARDAYRVLNVRPDAHQAVVKAAYRALAALYHPDVNPGADAVRKMAALNRAYEEVRTPDRRAVYDKLGTVTPSTKAWAMGGTAPPPARRADNADSGVIDFGRYDGWTIADLARHDPEYLRWLSRHTSGARFRREIDERLGAAAAASAPPKPTPRRRMWSRSGA